MTEAVKFAHLQMKEEGIEKGRKRSTDEGGNRGKVRGGNRKRGKSA